MSVPAQFSQASNSLLSYIRGGGALAELFQSAANQQQHAAARTLRDCKWPILVQQLASEARERVSTGIAASPLAVLRECRAGCSMCCRTVAVDVTPLEAIVVAEYLVERYSNAELAPIRERLRINADRRRTMTADERRRVRMPCALLNEQNLCSVYEARPLACAGFFSLSLSACEQAYVHQDLSQQQVPQDQHAKTWTMGVAGGLQHALVDAGLDGNLYDLHSAVLCALDTPKAAMRWLSAEDIFVDCVCTDAHSPPRRPVVHWRVDPPHSIKTPQLVDLPMMRKTNKAE